MTDAATPAQPRTNQHVHHYGRLSPHGAWRCGTCGQIKPQAQARPVAPAGVDISALGLNAEQTAILRDHLASRQQTVSEFLGDMLMDIGLGRATGKEYPPPATEKPDPLVTYTDPAGGPDWEPQEDEA